MNQHVKRTASDVIAEAQLFFFVHELRLQYDSPAAQPLFSIQQLVFRHTG